MSRRTVVEGTSEVSEAGVGSDEVGVPEVLRNMRAAEPELPTVALTDSKAFGGFEVKQQPPSFRGTRRDMLLIASDDVKSGDQLIIRGEGGERTFQMGGYCYKHFCWLNDLRSAGWFRGNFDADQRGNMANSRIQRMADRDLTFFYQETPEGLFLLNMVPDRKPVLSDIEFLEVIEDELGNIEVDSWHQGQYGLDLRILTEKFTDLNPQVGDIMKHGVYLHNSQIGVDSPDVDGFTKRLTCLNGATTEVHHKAWTLADRDGSVANPDLKIWLREAIQNVVKEMEKMGVKAAAKREVPASAHLLSDIITKHHLNKKTVKAINEAYEREPAPVGQMPSVFAVAQSINRAAHEGKFEYDLRTRLEGIAGELLFA